MVIKTSVNRLLVSGLLALVLIGRVYVARADGPRSGGNTPAAEKRLEQLTKTLQLTTEQQQQIAPILVETDELIGVIWQDESVSQQEKALRTNRIIRDANRKIAAVLNAEQAAKFFRDQAKKREGDRDKTQAKD